MTEIQVAIIGGGAAGIAALRTLTDAGISALLLEASDRLGAMIFGRDTSELIQLNESTLWSGGPVGEKVNPEAPKFLPQVREAIFAGNYKKASDLSKKMQGLYTESYLPLGDLLLTQNLGGQTPTAYYRDLDIHAGTTPLRRGGSAAGPNAGIRRPFRRAGCASGGAK